MTELVSTFTIDDARVETTFPSDTVHPTEEVDVEVSVQAGDEAREVTGIRFGIATTFVGEKHNPYSDHATPEYGEVVEELDEVELVDHIEVDGEETATCEASIQIPQRTPLTRGDARVSIQTGLAINWSVDMENPTDITVEPTPVTNDVMEALEELGFVYRQMDCSRDRYRGFRQELEYEPTAGAFFGAMDELQVFFEPGPDQVRVELLPTQGMWDDDSRGSKWHDLTIEAGEEVDDIVDKLEAHIEKHS